MRTALLPLLLGSLLVLVTGTAAADDKEDAASAANAIIDSLRASRYEQLWDTQTSSFFKGQITKEAFIESLTVGRSTLGAPGESAFMQMTTHTADKATGYQGDIYAFNYRNVYATGVFIERVLVIKDDDGVFRMSGLWGAPLPDQPGTTQ